MDALRNALGGQQGQTDSTNSNSNAGGGGGSFLDSLSNTANGALGGGEAGEKREDHLDKAVDLVQQHVLGEGDQSNENAAEQFKDEQISDAIRGAYKTNVGSDFPVADKS